MLHLHNRRLVTQVVVVFCFLAILAEAASAGVTAKEQLTAFTDKEFHELQSKARHGDATAALALGVAYEEGIRVQKNETEAVKWFQRAAAAGNAEVAHHLGVLYETGRLVHRITPKRPSGIARQRRWVSLLRNATWETCIAKVWECLEISTRQPNGMRWRRAEAMPNRKATWDTCTTVGKA